MDYQLFCKNYFQATGIPTCLLLGGAPVYTTIGELLSVAPASAYPLYPQKYNPSFERLSPDLEYGRVHVEGTGYDVILGPVFNVPMTDQLIRVYMHEQMLSAKYTEQLTEFFYAMPVVNHSRLVRHLSLIYLSLNQKAPNTDVITDAPETLMDSQNERHLQERMAKLESASIRNTYTFEISLYECIKDGNVERLIEYLNAHPSPQYEGKLASSPLRQAKNVFISSVQKAGLIGAIPGGVEIEKTYQLMDDYIQECEKLQNLEAISRLQYAMLVDFCQRAGETHIPEGISADVFLCMSYIRTHTNEVVSLGDVAAQIDRSVSYIVKKFKKELGINIGAYITRCKLEEAKSLLVFSNQTLSEISNYLCFSSQSYFQNVFKKQYGITPMQYRKRGRRI